MVEYRKNKQGKWMFLIFSRNGCLLVKSKLYSSKAAAENAYWALKKHFGKAMNLLKEARDQLVMCTMIDKSNHSKEIVDKIDQEYPEFNH